MERAKSVDEITAGAQEQSQLLEARVRAFEEDSIGFCHSVLL
jgi:hypothetical protein